MDSVKHTLQSLVDIIPSSVICMYIKIHISNIILPGTVDNIYIISVENKFHIGIVGPDCCSGKHDRLVHCF